MQLRRDNNATQHGSGAVVIGETAKGWLSRSAVQQSCNHRGGRKFSPVCTACNVDRFRSTTKKYHTRVGRPHDPLVGFTIAFHDLATSISEARLCELTYRLTEISYSLCVYCAVHLQITRWKCIHEYEKGQYGIRQMNSSLVGQTLIFSSLFISLILKDFVNDMYICMYTCTRMIRRNALSQLRTFVFLIIFFRVKRLVATYSVLLRFLNINYRFIKY